MSEFASRVQWCLRCVALIGVLGWPCVQAQPQPRPLSLPLDNQWGPARALPLAAPVVSPALTPPAVVTNTADKSTAVSAIPLDRLSVGVGDQIFITVFGQPDMSAEVTVNDNAQVTLPLIGTLKIGGFSPPAIEKLIAQRLKDGEYLRNPEVSVQVRQVRSQMISVLGEVLRPGRFPILGKLTVLDALATAGGLTPKADRTVFLLRRNGADGTPMNGDSQRKEIAIRLDQLIDSGKEDLDVELKNDDVVFVAPQKVFYIHGEVRRPGAYPMEAELDVMRVLAISGGVTERGSLRRIRIHRKDANQKIQVLTPDLNAPIVNGDVVYVDERLF